MLFSQPSDDRTQRRLGPRPQCRTHRFWVWDHLSADWRLSRLCRDWWRAGVEVVCNPLDLHFSDHRADRNRLPVLHLDANQSAFERRRYLSVYLVRDDLYEGLVTADKLTLLLEPVIDRALSHRLAELRHGDRLYAHS